MATRQSSHVFRADKFIVPDETRDEFVTSLRRTHELLAEQPGFVQDLLLEQTAGPGEFNFVTIVEWESSDAINEARTTVEAMHERRGFDSKELFSSRDITADIATYALIGGTK